MRRHPSPLIAIVVGFALLVSACGSAALPGSTPGDSYLSSPDSLEPVSLPGGARLKVVATTSILGDVVAQVGGDHIELELLIPLGVDPHAFEPSPRDARRLAQANVVFVVGFGLETFLDGLIRQAGAGVPVVSVSEGIEPLESEGEVHEEEEHDENEVEGKDHAQDADEHGVDPHTWFDPNNVIHWTAIIEQALAALDPNHAEAYAANADRYRRELQALDQDIRQAVSRIPPDRRTLVTDHEELGYFAEAYGFTIVGAVIPGASSLAEPSATQLAALLDEVRAQGVPAVFVSSVVHPTLVNTFAADAGIEVVVLYGHSLTDPEGPAPGYLELMRYNARAIVAALAP